MVKDYLRGKGACEVVLQTPYGIAKSPFLAVDRDHKLDHGKVVAGKVGHDRIQQASGEQSIGEAIRYWYGLQEGQDFRRIDVEAIIHPKGHFIVIPTMAYMRGKTRGKALEKVHSPLSFHHDHQSKLWRQQIDAKRAQCPGDIAWAASQIARVVADHRDTGARNILESDLLRTAGALSLLGLDLSPYLGKGYDCAASRVQFEGLPVYSCPVEVKNRSKGFTYQITRYTDLPRAIVLCMTHDFVNPPDDIDIIELSALAAYLGR
jgi:hypothetical protein